MKWIVPTLAVCWLFSFAMTGCIGFFVGPGASCQSGDLFESVPYVAKRSDGYWLCWNQGSYPFYFLPRHRVRDDALWFSVQGSTSTGDAKWRHFEVRIEGKRAIEAIEHGGAFWWEPDGSGVRLEVVEDEPTTKTAEPSATDNPDGAQRLREDH